MRGGVKANEERERMHGVAAKGNIKARLLKLIYARHDDAVGGMTVLPERVDLSVLKISIRAST